MVCLKTLIPTLLAGLTLVSSGTLKAGDQIRQKTDDGSVIILDDGSVWKVDPYDRYDSRFWSRYDNIIVNDDESALINTDVGEKVDATRIE
jgi:hypothetical protein